MTSAPESYAPALPPNDEQALRGYVYMELLKIAAFLEALNFGGTLPETNEAPTKLREGMIRFADGTNWNPGSGQGIYAYYGGSWNKL